MKLPEPMRVALWYVGLLGRRFFSAAFLERKARRLVNEYTDRRVGGCYSSSAPLLDIPKHQVVFLATREARMGGLADRIKGMLEMGEICRKEGFDFRIFFDFPFVLSDYLLPPEGGHDWRIDKSEISRNTEQVAPVILEFGVIERQYKWFCGYTSLLKGFLKSKKPQVHITTNINRKLNVCDAFRRTFSLSPKLSVAIEKLFQENSVSAGEYISISARFRNLLGDFNEVTGGPATLDAGGRHKLIDECLMQLRNLRDSRCGAGEKVFVTSDSVSFLEAASKEKNVFILPGRMSHIDSSDVDEDTHLKTFVDLFTISKAKESYLLMGKDMFQSGFAPLGAAIGDHHFENIRF